MRGDGLPSSVTLIAPCRGGRPPRRSRGGDPGALRRADGRDWSEGARAPPSASCSARRAAAIALAVVGAHLAGLPLNRELVELGGTFVREAETTTDYRLFALPGTPAKPGLLRVANGAGTAIKAELWSLDPAASGPSSPSVPAPLSIGAIRLEDGSSVKGFLVEAEAVAGASRHLQVRRLAQPIWRRSEDRSPTRSPQPQSFPWIPSQ